MEEEEEYEDELNWYDDEVGVVIFTTPRSYDARRLRLWQQQLCTEEEADYEDLGDYDYNEVRARLRWNLLQTEEDL